MPRFLQREPHVWFKGIVVLVFGVSAFAQGTLSLNPSHPSPWQVGGIVTWTATPGTGAVDANWYRFRARRAGEPFRIWKDYGPDNSFQWTASDRPGEFDVEVSARNRNSSEVSTATAHYVMLSNTIDGRPVLLETAHPLVLLYSGNFCAEGSRMKVRFQAADGFMQDTPYQACDGQHSMNVYLAALRAETEYFAYQIIDDGDSFEPGPVVTASTQAIRADIPDATALTPVPSGATEPIVLHENVFASQIATDLAGNTVWYYPGAPLSFMTRPAGGGLFLGIVQDPSGDPWRQVLREFNVVGLSVRETNAGRVNEQLKALGKRQINSFHHEALRLPDGNIAVLAGVEQILTGVQGLGATDVLGDMVIVLNPSLQVVWTWDAFDHLDTHRSATLGEQCVPNVCPPLTLASTANDWTHGNGIEATADGNLLVSLRNQDWIVKIKYDSGEGNGDMLWRLGTGGDFKLLSSDSTVWFSHQHDPRYEPLSNDRLMLLDNGNVRRGSDLKANSRGQVYQLDEQARTATVILNADLGRYSLALGSAQKLSSGNYWFVAGFLPDASGIAVEVDPSGKTVYSLGTAAPVYRSYRLSSLYGPVRGSR